jgi:polysaccharide pyruvyl transferase WcaK-like protein
MNTAGFDNDCVISQKIIEQMENVEGVTIFGGDYSAAEMMGIISRCEFMLVNRFHSMILSFASHVPFFSIAYEHKFDGMTERFGVPENNVDLVGLDANELRRRIEVVWHNRQQVKETITQKYDELVATLNVNVKLMFDLAEKRKIDYEKYADYFV